MYLYIITPCSRPENLHTIAYSINIPKENYSWIVVHDSLEIPDKKLLPYNSLHIASKVEGSVVGHGQRNIGLDLVPRTEENWIYFNDDDTIIYQDLWDNIQGKGADYDFIHFHQENKDHSIRLDSGLVELCHMDSHNFIFKASLLGNTKFIISDYCADGYFAKEIYEKAKSPLYIEKVLSTYNALR